jgi:lysophospholipase
MTSLDTIETGDGATIRYGIWKSSRRPGHGSVFVLAGRKEFLEKYAETIGDLNRRGYDVCSFDWRGQGLSSRLLPDRLKGHIESYDQYLVDLNRVYELAASRMPAVPYIVLAHSMGAHIALRYFLDHPQHFDRAVFTAPMIDIYLKPYPRWLVRAMVRWAVAVKRTGDFMPGGNIHSNLHHPFEGNKLTADPVRFQIDKQAVAANPDLAVGGPTFGWLAATFDSIRFLQQSGTAERINLPLLMVSAANDRIVCNRAIRSICRRIRNCKTVEIKDARHEILMETDSIRDRFWKQFDDFVP